MDRQLDEADFVLVVCSEGYYRKAKAGGRPTSGLVLDHDKTAAQAPARGI
jgi:hypothetical protein